MDRRASLGDVEVKFRRHLDEMRKNDSGPRVRDIAHGAINNRGRFLKMMRPVEGNVCV